MNRGFNSLLSCLCLFAIASGTGCVAQRTYDSPDEAVKTLVSALRARDADQLKQIFGSDGLDILTSGDKVADRQTAEQFLEKYDQKNEIKLDGDQSATLLIGDDGWPLPIPIVKSEKGTGWVFDVPAGKEEILNRRIGRNELTVMEVCQAICDAQREYALRDIDGDSVPGYARKFISDEGKKNGLYWPTAEGEQPSPLGELVAEAHKEGYGDKPDPNGKPRPYHGYFYRILTAQGKDAPGGAVDYVVQGKLILGFAVVAWPAQYGSSGIMTFITNYQGDVYQKDLGEKSDKEARAMTEFNPDSSWKKVEKVEQVQ